jgi:hypothetical protein
MILAAELRHTLSPEFEDLTRLRGWRDLEDFVPINSRNLDIGAQGGLGEVDIKVEDKIVLTPPKELVRLHIQDQEETAAGAASGPRFALARQSDLSS